MARQWSTTKPTKIGREREKCFVLKRYGKWVTYALTKSDAEKLVKELQKRIVQFDTLDESMEKLGWGDLRRASK